ncbi:MAG: DUF3795 domain-containing protein [Anaerolineales bacterium]|nr:DUF3795 domain-containing protein [Anaerolineales bacterium]
MTTQLLAYCGLECSTCPAYVATQDNDIAKLTDLAQEWFGGEIEPSQILCDGCNAGGRLMHWCSECSIRACASERGEENCAHCDDYGCEKLQKVFEQSVEAKANLDRIRALL